MLDPVIVFVMLVSVIVAFSIYPVDEDPKNTAIFEYEQDMLEEQERKR